jgi:MltA-interacting protein MipA
MHFRLLILASTMSVAAAAASPERPPASDWSVAVGGGALALPSHPGAASLRVLPLPFVDIRYKDVLFLSPIAGLGVNALSVETARFGVAFSPDFGRSASSSDRLRGFGDISAGAMVKVFGTYSVGPVALLADVRRELGGGDGTLADAGVTTTMPILPRLLLSATATLTWADAQYGRCSRSSAPSCCSGRPPGARWSSGGSSRASAASSRTGCSYFDKTTSTSPSLTAWPSLQRISATLASSGDSTGISIFMLSRMTSTSPAETASPCFFSIFHTVPVMCACTSIKVPPKATA